MVCFHMGRSPSLLNGIIIKQFNKLEMEALEKGLSSESLVNVTPKESRIVLVQAS